MKKFKVRYRGTANERIIQADTMKQAKLAFHEQLKTEGQAPLVYVESYIQASRA